ncbi:CPBP family intramembrane glutamic endopeptidase [Leucobacter soli]|uniref:CPBP family intramembrane glutamic endopeptidase n=1 Tax=Leucobacter soli TaxID=2812850 RepID=UPI00361813DF
MTNEGSDPTVNPQPPTDGAPAPDAAPTPQWAWAKPVQEPQWVETPPLAYHQLLRGVPRYRWWKPLLALLLGVLYYLTLSVAFGLIVIFPYLAFSGADLLDPDAILELALPDTQKPVSMLLTLGSVALMLPSALLAMLSVGLTPAKRLWSVALRIRWRWIGRTVLPAFATLFVMNSLGIVFELALAGGAVDDGEFSMPHIDPTAALWSAGIALLLVPVQATAEELVYRGMFMQTLGAWLGGVRGATAFAAFLRGPWLVILVPAILFGFSHIYDIWGWLMVVALAVVAGWLTWRTGGLEAAISIHVVNNLVAFGFMTVGFGGETGQTESGGGRDRPWAR